MPRVDLQQLPDDARLWVFGAERPLGEDEERDLLTEVDAFLGGWQAHGAPLTCARDWRYGQFLLVGVDERSVPPSGCSIDSMVRVLKVVEERLGARLVDNTPIWYREGEEVKRVARSDFRALARSGAVGPLTTVFDNTLTRLGQLRVGEWERPAAESWHGRAFLPTDR